MHEAWLLNHEGTANLMLESVIGEQHTITVTALSTAQEKQCFFGFSAFELVWFRGLPDTLYQ